MVASVSPIIYQTPTVSPASIGTLPNFKFMVCGNSLSEITVPGYLNQIDLQSSPVSTTDILQILFNFNPATQVGDYGAFAVSIENGVITLSPATDPGEIILPVTNKHFANWANTTGSLSDQGYFPSDELLTNVAMVDIQQAPSPGNFVIFQDSSGTIVDNQYSPSNALLSVVSMAVINTPPVVGNLVQFSDTGGSIVDSGQPLTNLINRNSQNSFNTNGALYFDAASYTAVGPSITVGAQSGVITTESLTTASGSEYVLTITPGTTLVAGAVIMFQLRTDGTNTAGNNIVFNYSVASLGQPILLTILNANAGALNGTVSFAYFIVR